MLNDRRPWLHLGLLGGTVAVAALAAAPPFVPAAWRPLLYAAFAPACHQLPARSPHVDGVALAVCDRCVGIYLGLVAGVAAAALLRSAWRGLGQAGRYVLLGALLPLGIDWIAGWIGLWQGTPFTRAGTGFLFGTVAASFVVHSLLARSQHPSPPESA
jgi:uncharacterized membrane protein